MIKIMLNPYQKKTTIKTLSGQLLLLDKAKKYPISQLYTGTVTKKGKNLMGCCPFHSESNPSFVLYPETNSWYCFAGCGGGDVVSFYQKLHNCGFNQAVTELGEL